MLRIVAFLILAVLVCVARSADLMPCPDCEKPVSPRAVMCPHCGCPGEAIHSVVESNRTANVELPSFCHSLVLVTSDQGTGVGVCIRNSAQLYVLTSQNLLAGAQSLTLAKMLDGHAIPYTSIELASDRNLVRLAVNATNLQAISIADSNRADLALTYVASNKTVALMQTGAVKGPLPAGTPLLDAATNLVMVLGSADAKHAANVASVPTWVRVQPLSYRTQTSLLIRAGKRNGDGPAVLKQLQETKWLTPYLAQQAETLAKELQQQRSAP